MSVSSPAGTSREETCFVDFDSSPVWMGQEMVKREAQAVMPSRWIAFLPDGCTLPAVDWPGIWTGALNWNSVFLFHSSASTGRATNDVSANKPLR
jgi:hypothetical protein